MALRELSASMRGCLKIRLASSPTGRKAMSTRRLAPALDAGFKNTAEAASPPQALSVSELRKRLSCKHPSPSAALPQALVCGTAFRLASSFSTTRDPPGVSSRKLLWDGSPWVHENPFPLSVTLAKEATAGEHDSAEMVSRTGYQRSRGEASFY